MVYQFHERGDRERGRAQYQAQRGQAQTRNHNVRKKTE
jgi:hypothetical protein